MKSTEEPADQSTQDFFRKDYLNKSDLRETGFGGTEEEWRYCRKIILQAVDHDGKMLDLGCANGRLVSDLHSWAKEEGISLDVYGVDFVAELVEKAKKRMPEITDHFDVADINDYVPKQKFDYIRTEIIHLNPNRIKEILERYLSKLSSGGKLIISRYDDQDEDQFQRFINYIKSLKINNFDVVQNEATCLVIFKKL